MQIPPSIPTLLVAKAVCFLRGTHLIIDWHNFGDSILALRLGRSHLLVRISRWYEKSFSHFAAAHFTVTKAMARVLKRDYWITSPVLVLHDRPAAHFRPLSFNSRLAFLGRLPETAARIDEIESKKLKILVSSTSWTPDEDFSLLLEALNGYSDLATSSHPYLPELLVIITGKGPQKEQYMSQIATLKARGKLEMVTIMTTWLSIDDYASLLASADLGISLHTSSSGVDLPMKVLDMFGAGLPIVGWGDFEAWPELVKDGENGRSFRSSEELQDALIDLLGVDEQKLATLRSGALLESKYGWDDEWDTVACEVFGLPK